jgi:hypothetical protein
MTLVVKGDHLMVVPGVWLPSARAASYLDSHKSLMQ